MANPPQQMLDPGDPLYAPLEAPAAVVRRWKWEKHGAVIAFSVLILLGVLMVSLHPIPKKSKLRQKLGLA